MRDRRLEFAQHCAGSVPAAVVDIEDFILKSARSADADEPGVRSSQDFLLVEARHDD